ncbi:MAG: hypothetical protein ACKO9T_01515, partial [Nitrospira sp.]
MAPQFPRRMGDRRRGSQVLMPGLFDLPVEQKDASVHSDRLSLTQPGDYTVDRDRRRSHWMPIRIVSLLLVPCLALTYYYAQFTVPGVG